MSVVLNIAMEYTKTPGGRHESEGQYSGEDFRKSRLKPAFEQSVRNGEELVVDLDGGYGYATSFLEEAFGGLARETKSPDVLKIKIKSDEEPALVAKVMAYMRDALV
ncbi:MAG: STAS-like domain-containing protein [Bacillota bacterium]